LPLFRQVGEKLEQQQPYKPSCFYNLAFNICGFKKKERMDRENHRKKDVPWRIELSGGDCQCWQLYG